MKKLCVTALVLLMFSGFAMSQGCIVIRNISGLGQYNLTTNSFSTSSWQANITTRYFKSFRDFIGTKDQRTPKQNESVNNVYSLDVSLLRLFKNGWSLGIDLPYTASSRASSLEHGGPNTKRHTTHSAGLGDIQIVAYKWLLSPSEYQRGNIQAGLGVKFATGDYKYQDYFYRNDSTKILSPVNPSIQLGDGGTGFVTSLNFYYFLNPKNTVSLYGDAYYLISPRDQSGTQFTAGRTPTPLQIASGGVELSVPDVYSARIGANFNIKNWTLSAGFRYEGVPVHDLFGASDGGRRAGYTLSTEPGIMYKFKKWTAYAYVPITTAHKIKQSIPDQIISQKTGVFTEGPGGSGDYQIFLGVQFNL